MYTVIDTADESLAGPLYPSKSAADSAATGETEEVVELTTNIEREYPDAILEGLAKGANTGALVRGDNLEESLDATHAYLQQEIFNDFVVPLLLAYADLPSIDRRNERAVGTAETLVDALPEEYQDQA